MLDFDSQEPESNMLRCVDPYEVTPCGTDARSPHTVMMPTSSEAFCGVGGRPLKLEMETFGDLSQYLSTTDATVVPVPLMPRCMRIDELNTPVFEKMEPSFSLHEQNSTVSNPVTYLDELYNITPTIHTTVEHNYNNDTLSGLNPADSRISQAAWTIQDSQSNISDKNPIHQSLEHNYYNSNERMSHLEEDSNSEDRKPRLNLNVGIRIFQQDCLNTPDIIETVLQNEVKGNESQCSLEEELLCILQGGCDDKVISTINFEDLEDPSTSSIQIPTITNQLPFTTQDVFPPISQKRPQRQRKRKSYDSDSDYEPPHKYTARSPDTHDSSYSDEDEEYVPTRQKKVAKTARRRPSTASSVTSDMSVVGSNYRELRDKNNEASRKSRLKRKVKEMQLEQEADELESQNVRLKARVEELEKMVNNFRNNLFKIMLKK